MRALDTETAVLRATFLCDVEACKHLDTAYERRMLVGSERTGQVQHPIETIPDAN